MPDKASGNSYSGFRETVRVNGAELRRLREEKSLSQTALVESLSADGIHMSLQSLRRAERGERVSKVFVCALARFLEIPLATLVGPTKFVPFASPDICGEWEWYSVEDGKFEPAYILEENVQIKSRTPTDFEIAFNAREFDRSGFSNWARIEGGLLSAFLSIEGWEPPAGSCCVQLTILSDNTVLDGYATWFEVDSGGVEVSRLIGIRPNDPNYSFRREIVFQEMGREMSLFDRRKAE